MPNKANTTESDSGNSELIEVKVKEQLLKENERQVHMLGDKFVCDTDSVGYATPNNMSPFDIVLDASEGFIPLWAKDQVLRWRFNQESLSFFQNPEAIKSTIRNLLTEALLKWEDAVPIRFTERDDAYDFQIIVNSADRCNPRGCVLASAFFPDSGRHALHIYPKMFTQTEKEQLDTMIHEIGHVFGLRHFFAPVAEQGFPSVIFGSNNPFSIMNYGELSELTDADKNDLRTLYQKAWSGEFTNINGTPIRFVKPYHTLI